MTSKSNLSHFTGEVTSAWKMKQKVSASSQDCFRDEASKKNENLELSNFDAFSMVKFKDQIEFFFSFGVLFSVI